MVLFIKDINTKIRKVWFITFLFCALKLVRFYYRKKYKTVAPSVKHSLPLMVFLIQIAMFSFKQTHFLNFQMFDWYTIMLPTILICVYYCTVILGNAYVFVRDGEKKFKAKLKLDSDTNLTKRSGKNTSTRSVTGISTHSQSSKSRINQTEIEERAKRGKFLRFAIFMSEFLFVSLIILICVRYANYELKMDSSIRLKIATVAIFSANISLHIYCFIYTVIKPLLDFKKVYDGDEND